MILVVLAAWAGAQDAGASAGVVAPVQLAQVTVRERVIIRVPMRPPARPTKPMKWKEKKGPRCLALDTLAGAVVTANNSVDLIMRGGHRFRARLDDDCPALDFYSGFYLKPTRDGRICADRDTIHARSGGQCEIQNFRSLAIER